MKALVGAFNQEKALVGAFSVLTNLRMELFQGLVETADCDQIRHEVDHGRGEKCLVTTAFIVRPTAEAAPSPRRDDYLIE